MRLIDADVLLKEWRLECGGSCFIRKGKYCMHYDRTKGVCTLIIKAPTIEPTKHGRWLETPYCAYDDTYKCSVCGKEWEFIKGTPQDNEANYCPKCGARMDEVEE